MPFVDEAPRIDLGNRVDFPKGMTITPGEEDLNDGPAKTSWNWGAAFRRNNEVAAALSSESLWTLNEPEAGFNPWEKIKGTPDEANFARLSEARNQRRFDAIKADIARENDDRKLLDSQPWWMGLATEGSASILSPTTLLPGGSFVKGARGGLALARSAASVGGAAAAGTAIQEGMLHSVEQTRTVGESATAIGASALLGGLLGSAASFMTKAEWQKAIGAIESEIDAPRTGLEPLQVLEAANSNGRLASVGAAANVAADITDNSIAGGAASATAAATARMNPLLRALHSPSSAYREIATDLVENPLYLKKNFEGVASEPAVETLMKEYNAGLAQALRATNAGYLDYVKAGGQLDRSEFREAVGKAMRRGDADADPVVARVAREYRAKVFDPLKQQAIDAKLLPEDVSVDTAQSYFTRMWNGRRISADEAGFKAMVQEHINAEMPKLLQAFDRETALRETKLTGEKLVEYQVERRIERSDRFNDRDAAKQIADEVFDTLTGRAGTGNRPDFITIKARGPLKERTFNIPDLFRASNGRGVEDYLEHDVEQVARRYTRVMGADVELARKFGSVDMVDQITKIREDYRGLRDGVTDERQLKRLADRETADIRDLEAVRDMLRGTNPGAVADASYSRVVRSVNHFNYLRSMGEVAIASLTETVRPAMVHGLTPYMETLGQTLTNMKGIRLSVGEGQLAGNIAENVLGTRLATLSEIIDPYASRGPVEAFLENMTNIASKWNGIRLLTDMQKSIASVMTQNRLLRGATMFDQVAEKERAYLAYMGIDQSMASRIAKQFAEHGETVDKVRVANTEMWTDEVARRTYRAAINKDVDSIITTKGVADTPLFANTPTGRAMLQFKSFALASHQRVLLRGLQEEQSRFVGGLVAMTTIGMMATWLKAVSGNRTEKLQDATKNPGWWIAEGLDKAGIFAIPMEIANTFEKATGFNPIKSPIKAADEGAAISQKNQNRSLIGTVVGPSAGLVDDATQVLGVPKKIIDGEEVTQGQKNAAERLLPFNSYAGIRQMLRYIVNPQEQ
ncbi:hypothetical protein [Tardiphaga sp.]|jgi:hypothetical protein|uniref:hypothetical protein n=1 Tax=Tardiphaga sp. TaxID=1926292 RepID=UPI0037D9BA3E